MIVTRSDIICEKESIEMSLTGLEHLLFYREPTNCPSYLLRCGNRSAVEVIKNGYCR